MTWRGSSGGQQELFPPEFPPLVLSTLLLSFHLFNPFPRTSPGCLAAFPLASPSLSTKTFLLLPPLLLLHLTSLFRLPLTFFPPRHVPSGLFFSFYFPTPATQFPASSSSLSPPLSHISVAISFCSLFFFPSLHLFLSTLCVFHRGSAASPGRSHSNTGSFQPAASPCSTATMLSVI